MEATTLVCPFILNITLELTDDDKLSFLDISIIKKHIGKLQFTVFSKPTRTEKYIKLSPQIRAAALVLSSKSFRLAEKLQENLILTE